jgi:hypothetical protein
MNKEKFYGFFVSRIKPRFQTGDKKMDLYIVCGWEQSVKGTA